ncbi:MAG: hypothetical protein ACTS6J_09095 [Burkholderiales bacterium]
MKRLAKSALLFLAIGLALYAALYYAAEQLMVQTGRSNPLFKIAVAQESTFDWLILGASHAMPMDFADFNMYMQGETGLRILNLASPGTGPLYNRFVLEHFLRAHRTKNVLYVADSFAFYSRSWNEERFADAKLLRRTPLEPAIAMRLGDYARDEGVDPRALLDYVTGFSKINNRERFERDVWEGEAQFERVYRPSASAVKKRVAYLYPDKTAGTALSRYLEAFSALIATAKRSGANVVVIKMPTPSQYRSQLPDEAAFDQAMLRLLAAADVRFHDFTQALDEPSFYFDTDHLNRAGLTQFLARDLKPVLMQGKAG